MIKFLTKALSRAVYKKNRKELYNFMKWVAHCGNGTKYNKLLEEYNNMKEDVGEISDGYHTFNELYEFRKVYNALVFNEWYKQKKYNVHKSKRHFDGELCFGGGWFIVVAELPSGQITNHYQEKDWDLFNVEECYKSKVEFDGHTPKDVLARMKEVING